MYMYVFNILQQTLHIRLLFVYGKINIMSESVRKNTDLSLFKQSRTDWEKQQV